ncbi:MAG TPA: DNA/RNA non-specific endonuclease [Acidobacteriaceae bacterium]|jgi:hypothetical protein|nr:DNA/RNA non-specific endonuclease [Acidobacteriaceae bacterium]
MITEKTYRDISASCQGASILADLPSRLVPLWCEEYVLTSPSADIVEVETGSPGSAFTYLFDIQLERAIAAFGIPSTAKHARDKSRLRGHPLAPNQGLNRGHLMAHSIGGELDINLAPQAGKLNQGAFKRLEAEVLKLAQDHQQSFYFVRLIYSNPSQLPALFEQCIIRPNGHINYALHQNA